MIELALTLSILLLVIQGIMDFGFAFSDEIAIANAARNGARYATTHPTAWTNAASPAITTIEGVIMSAGGASSITNDDSHITVAYLTSGGTACGQYSQASNSFVAASGYTQATCVVAGNLIKVTVTYTFNPITPGIHALFSHGMTLTGTATMVEEQ